MPASKESLHSWMVKYSQAVESATEINLMGGESHVELRADFPGGFPGHLRSAFEEEGCTAAEDAMFDYLRTLLHLRKKHSALATGRMIHYPPTWNDDVYTFLRLEGDETILVVVNGREEVRSVDLSELAHWFDGPAEYRHLLSGEEGVLEASEDLRVDALGIRILQFTGRSR